MDRDLDHVHHNLSGNKKSKCILSSMEKKEILKLRNDETTVIKPVVILSRGHYKWMIM